MKKSDSESNEGKQVGFIGPSQANWVKFKLAGIAWKLTRGTNSSVVAKVPYAKSIAMWAFKVRVLSRDMDLEIENADKIPDSTSDTGQNQSDTEMKVEE